MLLNPGLIIYPYYTNIFLPENNQKIPLNKI